MTVEWDDAMLQEALKKLQKVMPENVEHCMEKACAAVEAEAKARCPVGDTGELRRSITFDVRKDADEIAGIVGSTVEYAPYVHEGTGIYAKNGNGRKHPHARSSGRRRDWRPHRPPHPRDRRRQWRRGQRK